MIKTCFGSLKGVEAVGMISGGGDEYLVQPEGDPLQLPVTVKFVNTGFWKVFPFRFLSGKPFTEADQQSAIRTVVMAESLARRLYGTTEAVGKFVSVNFKQYRVCGVVKDASLVTGNTYALLWIPYTAEDGYKPNSSWYDTVALGSFNAYILASRDTDLKALKKEAEEVTERYGKSLGEDVFTGLGQPDYYSLLEQQCSELCKTALSIRADCLDPAAGAIRQPLGDDRLAYGAAVGRDGRQACFRCSDRSADGTDHLGKFPLHLFGRTVRAGVFLFADLFESRLDLAA